jgi:hypothetical protein
VARAKTALCRFGFARDHDLYFHNFVETAELALPGFPLKLIRLPADGNDEEMAKATVMSGSLENPGY